MKEKTYLMSVGCQLKKINKYCFKCGAIICGQVRFEGGYFAVCRKDDCKHEIDRVEIGECELDNGNKEYVIVRKLN